MGRLARDGSNKYSNLVGIYQLNLDEIDNSQSTKIVTEAEKRIPLYLFLNANLRIKRGEEIRKSAVDRLQAIGTL